MQIDLRPGLNAGARPAPHGASQWTSLSFTGRGFRIRIQTRFFLFVVAFMATYFRAKAALAGRLHYFFVGGKGFIMEMSPMFLAYSQVTLAVVTLLATGALVYFTAVLAKHTKRMADNTARPHVVVTLEPNRWSLMHFDLRVANTGNAAAFDIKATFSPPLPIEKFRHDRRVPLQNITVLRPGQKPYPAMPPNTKNSMTRALPSP